MNNKGKSKKSEMQNPAHGKVSDFVVNNQQAFLAKFGGSIKARRSTLNLTQTELAKLAGLNRSYLSEVENGLVSISIQRAEKIAQVLGCALSDLLK
jgi:DNA-binding XRE family transcriptional regulator